MLQHQVEAEALQALVLPEPLQEGKPCLIAQALFLETDQLLPVILLAGLKMIIIMLHLRLLRGETLIARP